LHLRRIGLVPMRVVAMAVNHQVDVHIPKTGKDSHAFSGNHFCAGRNREGADLAYGFYSFPVNDDDAVSNRRAAKPVDQRSADESFYVALRVSGSSKRTEEQTRSCDQDQRNDAGRNESSHVTSPKWVQWIGRCESTPIGNL